MARNASDVTETELAVLQVLWERGPATRRQITDVLYPGGGPAHFTTVQKLLERLESKGHVLRQWQEGVLTFVAVTGREELINRRLRDLAQQLCGGSLTPLLMNLVREGELTPTELEQLQALVRRLNPNAKTRGGEKGKAGQESQP
jgi:predicted transcriptional regulator